MSRERSLGVVALGVTLIMALLLSRTSINQRWLDLGDSGEGEGMVGSQVSLQHELARLAVRQHAFYGENGHFATTLVQLRFGLGDPKTTLIVPTADSAGWTAIAFSAGSPVVCRLSGGTGAAATVPADSIALPESHAGSRIIEGCGEDHRSVAPQVLSQEGAGAR